MPRRALAFLLVLIIALIFLSGCFSKEPSLPDISYMYALHIRTETPIENVTFLVPLPTRGDRPAVGPESITADFYSGHLPKNFTSSIVQIEGRHYLQLTAPFMDSGEQIFVNRDNSTSPGRKLSPEVVPHLINTLHPFGNESLFFPKQNLTLTEGSPGMVKTHGANPGYTYTYTIPIYAHYENGTRVEIFSAVRGSNEWVEGFDQNRGNYYSDSYYLTITGEPQGWMPAGGMIMAGSGTYREWQVGSTPDASAG